MADDTGVIPACSWIVPRLTLWAQVMAARFNGEVRLCGSSLIKAVPRDVDVRIVVDDWDFFNRYDLLAKEYQNKRSQAWMNDVGKLTKDAVRSHMLNLDIQVEPASHAYMYRLQKYIVLASVDGRRETLA